ncbi:MAG: helix-turn-helix domain-containing protein [Lachnospiraceae bacterium]|nr:helix-turn-helix domain-containing protein [Lachnospiraceae bacterium]
MEARYISIKQMESGKRIRTLMREKGFSVREIQEIMGFENPQAVYKWTSGKSLPSIDNLLNLSRVLGVHMDELLVTDEEPGLCA